MKSVQLLLCLIATCGAQKPSRWDAKGQESTRAELHSFSVNSNLGWTRV